MRAFAALLAGSLSLVLIGCSTGTVPTFTGTPKVTATGVHGIVHGGQQPVTGATITLWSVGTGGYGSAGTSLATTTTDATGSFNITGSYTCPGSDPYVYITSTGGNPGLTNGTNNTAISLMAALTDCNTLKTNAATTYIFINEATTVASVYALQQFMNASTGAIGSYGYSNTGLQNAFQAVNNLVSTSLGTAYSVTPNGNGVVPQQEINTLADILASCVNTSSGSSTACSSLFSNVTGSPANTLMAALGIAQHPAANVANLFALAGGTPPFQPTLSAAPNDFTVALSYNVGGTGVRSIAIDGPGNVWTTNGSSNSISKVNTLGVPQNGSPFTGGSNLSVPITLAIDASSSHVWVGNAGNGNLLGFLSNGNSYAGPISGLNTPDAMAFDANGYLWIADNGNSSVAEFNTNSNSFLSSGSGYTSQIVNPSAIAMDTTGNAWVANATTVTELSSLGVVSGASPISVGGVTGPNGIALDGSGNVWESNANGKISELNSSGAAVSGSGGYSVGASSGGGIAIDGANNAWTTDPFTNRIYKLSSAGSAITPGTGYQGGNLNSPHALAIDESGNLWIANSNTTTTGGVTTSVSEFVGLAAPVYTPLAEAVSYSQLGAEPGTPIAVTLASNAVAYYTPGTAYQAQLYASGGNSGSYTFSSSSTFPSGLSISSGGLISGTTSATGSTTVIVQACDANNTSNCGTQSYTLTANTTLAALGNESALNGSYAVEIEGYRNGSSAAKVYGIDILASLTFNGSGTIAGEEDVNNASLGSGINATVTGSYVFGSDNRGTMVITRTGGTAIEYAIMGENFSGGKPQTLRLVEFDNTGITNTAYATGSGVAKLQTSGAFVQGTLNQSFAFGMQGETPCNNDGGVNPSCPTVSPFGPLSVVGQFTGNNSNSITSGEEDAAGVNNTWNAISLTGTYTNPDSSGRGTLTLTAGGTTYPAAGSNFVYYIVNSGEMFLMTTDGHATKSLLTGDVLVQSASLSNSTITGNYIAWEESPSGGDGTSIFPSSLNSSLLYLAVQSGSQISVTLDKNNGNGQLKLEQSQGTLTYSVASNGRMTLGASGVPVFYVAGSGQFFGTEQPSGTNTGGPGLITALQQTAGTFGCPSTGTFGVGTLPLPIQESVFSGYYVASTGAILVDYSSFGGQLLQGNAGTSTCTTDSQTSTTGRFLLTTSFSSVYGNNVGYDVAYPVVVNSKYIMLSVSPTDGRPAIISIDK